MFLEVRRIRSARRAFPLMIAGFVVAAGLYAGFAPAADAMDRSVPTPTADTCAPGALKAALGAWYVRGYCNNPAGIAMLAEPNLSAPHVDYLRSTVSWFACGRNIGGQGWLYTWGDDNNRPGWVLGNGSVRQTKANGQTWGVPDCDGGKSPAPAAAPAGGTGVVNAAYRTGTAAPAGTIKQKAVQIALQQVGKPYSSAAPKGPNSFDCSGLIYYSYKLAGMNVPGSSTAMHASLPIISKTALEPGDIAWKQGHVGMYIGNGQIIEAKTFGMPVQVSPYDPAKFTAGLRV